MHQLRIFTIWMEVKACCLVFKVHFHQIILRGSCIIYIKRGPCIFTSSLKSVNLFKKSSKILIFPSANPISLFPVHLYGTVFQMKSKISYICG